MEIKYLNFKNYKARIDFCIVCKRWLSKLKTEIEAKKVWKKIKMCSIVEGVYDKNINWSRNRNKKEENKKKTAYVWTKVWRFYKGTCLQGVVLNNVKKVQHDFALVLSFPKVWKKKYFYDSGKCLETKKRKYICCR